MHFLKTLFWVVVAIVAVAFSANNWIPVNVNLWGGLVVVAKLPVLLLLAFLVGLLPTYALHLATRWRLRRRLETAERTLSETVGVVPSALDEAALPPGAAPIAVPPAG